ncbi:MAG: hypothetical protein NVS9B1_03230 [Candidatus Dormibacteraceae bacterium]
MGRRLLAVGFVVPLLLGVLLVTPGSPVHPTCSRAAGTHHVAVVVEHGTGAVLTACVAFSADQLSGDQVMQMSGIEYTTSGYGTLGNAVCQVDHEPATYPVGCWTSTSRYWGMFVSRAGGPWSVSSRGVSGQIFADGDALGWHYIPQSGAGGGPPPAPAGVCRSEAASPSPPNPSASGAAAPPTGTGGAVPTSAIDPGAGSPAPVAAVLETPTPVIAASPSLPPGTPTAPSVPVPGAGSSGPSADRLRAGWLATAAGAGALIGLLILQLLAGRWRR